MSKLTVAQEELLTAMKAGAKVHYMSGLHAHYFRTDNMRGVRGSTMDALERAGVVEKIKEDWRGCCWKAKQ